MQHPVQNVQPQAQRQPAPYVRPQLERLGNWKQLTEHQGRGSGRGNPY